jgi:KDO2-lipid IV(A) lauroyltransferase
VLAIFGYLLADNLARMLPPRAAEAVAVWTARRAFDFRHPVRAILERNLARTHPQLSAKDRSATARRSFEQFGRSLAEFLLLAHTSDPTMEGRIRVRGREHLASARSAGRGVIVLSAHAGNWEWGAAYLAAAVRTLHVIARPHPSRWVERFFRRRRASHGVRTLKPGRTWSEAASALRRGEWVAMMVDRPAPGSRRPPCAWAAALARRTGAVLLPAVVIRTGPGRYAACFAPPITPEDCAAGAYSLCMMRWLNPALAQWQPFETLPAGWA